MESGSKSRFGSMALCVAASALALAACSKQSEQDSASQATPAAAASDTAATAATTPAAAPAAPAAEAAPAADNTDTLTGVKLASFTGNVDAGKTAFTTCQTCHSADPGVNKIGPSLHGIVGREAGTVAGFNYSDANKNSGITWTPEKLFQYLEKPARVVPGTKMIFPGIPEPQKRADVIAYLKSIS
ncbi:c-type cytochrome [Sphingomonas sp. RS6]